MTRDGVVKWETFPSIRPASRNVHVSPAIAPGAQAAGVSADPPQAGWSRVQSALGGRVPRFYDASLNV